MVEFLRAQEKARDLRPVDADEFTGRDDAAVVESAYYAAVGDLERAWRQAKATAERDAMTGMSVEERGLLERARLVWKRTQSTAGTTAEERVTAYEQLEKLMGRLGMVSKSRTPKLLREIEAAKTQTRRLAEAGDR